MTDNKYDEMIDAFNYERNQILLCGTPFDYTLFLKRRGIPVPKSLTEQDILFHKTITGTKSLPIDYRVQSKKWLEARGLASLDKGELAKLSGVL
jgi:hypothetical protein